jgi:poly-gamma-glutamate synthesis protein (capsule biosynthesis protein)
LPEPIRLFRCGDVMTGRGIDPGEGRLVAARLVPLQARRFRLHRSGAPDREWLCELLNRLGAPFGNHGRQESDGSLLLEWR